ncbi:MAG: iron-sulfur cluster repair di-iron protein [Trebonia sp.]
MTDLHTVDLVRTLADLVAENPARAVILDRAGLDFCCHGQRTLAEACAASGLDPAQVAGRLDAVSDAPPADWAGGGRASLAAHVESTHHGYLHAELPDLVRLADTVRNVHSAHHPELVDMATLVAQIAASFEPHLATEETDVFPTIAKLEPGTAGDEALAGRIATLVDEHTALGAQLARLRELTDGYRTPADGCASYRLLYDRLAAMESDTHMHIHLENNVLFPAALAEAD